MNSIPNVIIGTWPLSGDFGNIDEINIERIINYSISKNFLEYDTAPNYGQGRMVRILSSVIKDYSLDFKINTKCGNNEDGIKSFELNDLEISIENSIKKFGKINTLFLHNPRGEIKNWEPIINMFNDYKNQNVISFTGISLAKNFPIHNEILEEFDYIQEEINLLSLDSYKRLINVKSKVVARSPLASGVLSGKLFEGSRFSDQDHRSSWLKKDRLDNILQQLKNISVLTKGSINEFARDFILSLPSIDSIIFGIKSQSHIDDLIKMSNLVTKLDSDVIESIFELSKNNYNLDNQKIGY